MKTIWHDPGYQHPYPLHNKILVSEDGDIIWWTAHGWSKPLDNDSSKIGVRWALLDDLLKATFSYYKTMEFLSDLSDSIDDMYQEVSEVPHSTDLAIILRAINTGINKLSLEPTQIAKDYKPTKRSENE